MFSKQGGLNKLFNSFSKFWFPIPIPSVQSHISPITDQDFATLICHSISEDLEKGIFFVKGNLDMTFKQFLWEYHNIKTFYLNFYFWSVLVACLNLAKMDKTFFISERILGLLYLQDVKEFEKFYITKIIS